jgi:ABC-type Fe3+ transport system permease subunit
MIAMLLRAASISVLVLAFVLLDRDINKTLDGAAPHVTKLGDAWYALHPTSLQMLQPAIERHVAEWLWNPVILSVLTAPACLVFAIVGAILMLLGRKKKPLIGYAR